MAASAGLRPRLLASHGDSDLTTDAIMNSEGGWAGAVRSNVWWLSLARTSEARQARSNGQPNQADPTSRPPETFGRPIPLRDLGLDGVFSTFELFRLSICTCQVARLASLHFHPFVAR